MANVCCPIEMEPKTLNQGQLSFAREIAADAVQKLEDPITETTTTIYAERETPEMEETEEVPVWVESNPQAKILTGRPCQCAAKDTTDSPTTDHINTREPLSAPF